MKRFFSLLHFALITWNMWEWTFCVWAYSDIICLSFIEVEIFSVSIFAGVNFNGFGFNLKWCQRKFCFWISLSCRQIHWKMVLVLVIFKFKDRWWTDSLFWLGKPLQTSGWGWPKIWFSRTWLSLILRLPFNTPEPFKFFFRSH